MKRSRHAFALVVALLPAIAFGCADILGVRDFVYVPDDGGARDGPVSDGADGGEASDAPSTMDADDASGCPKCANVGAAPCAVACGEASPKMLVLDGKTIAWVAGSGVLRAAALPSSAATTVASASPAPLALIATGGQLVWSDGTALRGAYDGGMRTLVTDAGAALTIAGPVIASPYPTTIYFGTQVNVNRCPLPDCTPPYLQVGARNGVTGLISTWQPSPSTPYGFWVDIGDPARPVVGAELVGGITIKTWPTQGTATGVLGASDSVNVYYATFSGGTSQVWRLGAGSPSYQTSGNVTGIAVAGTDALVAIDDTGMPTAGKVMKVFSGGGSQPVAIGQDRPSSITVDGTFVYWTTLGGNVMRAGR